MATGESEGWWLQRWLVCVTNKLLQVLGTFRVGTLSDWCGSYPNITRQPSPEASLNIVSTLGKYREGLNNTGSKGLKK